MRSIGSNIFGGHPQYAFTRLVLNSSFLYIPNGCNLVFNQFCRSYCFHIFLFLGPLFSVLPFLLLNSLWLVGEVVNLALPFLNHENGDFLILMRDTYLLMVQSSLQSILIFLSFFLCRCLTNVSCHPIPSPGFVNYERKSHSKICIVASECNFKECLFFLLCTKLMT
jgi:hypothetical protein